MNSLMHLLDKLPCCKIENGRVVEYNQAFFTEFDNAEIAVCISENSLTSTISYKNNLYSIYNIQDNTFVFFKKNNILKYVLSNAPSLELIDIKNIPQIHEETIDKQHLKITIIINSIIRATKVDTNYNELIIMLYDLQYAINEHFEYENKILDFGNDQIAEHIKEHKTLLENYYYLVSNLTGENFIYIISYLPEWFMKHIVEYDLKGKYLTK